MTKRHSAWRVQPSLLALLPLFVLGPPLQAREARHPLTAAERSDYRETTRYDDLTAFVSEVVDRAPHLYLTTMGSTSEGRSMFLVVVGEVADATPEGVRVAFLLLEPRSDDGLVARGLISDLLQPDGTYPILRAVAGSQTELSSGSFSDIP